MTQAAGGSFTTTGPISVPVSRTLTFTGGTATLGNGFVTGAGSIDFARSIHACVFRGAATDSACVLTSCFN